MIKLEEARLRVLHHQSLYGDEHGPMLWIAGTLEMTIQALDAAVAGCETGAEDGR